MPCAWTIAGCEAIGPWAGHDMEDWVGVGGDSPLSDSEVQSSMISLGCRPRWCDLRWCFTIVVLRQKLGACKHHLPCDIGGRLYEPLQAAIMGTLVWSLAGVNTSVTGKTGRLSECKPRVNNGSLGRILTSEKRFPHPICWHW